MDTPTTDLFFGLFELRATGHGKPILTSTGRAPHAVPDPHTGRPLKVASVEVSSSSVCPACTQLGSGGYIAFESDLRLAFACPSCRKLVWIAGA